MTYKRVIIPLFSIALLLFSSCGCPMKSVAKWQTVEVGTDINKQTEALTELVASAEGDIKELEKVIGAGKAEGKLNLKWGLSKETKKNIYKKTEWDKDVWHDIQRAQTAYCALYKEVKAGFYNGQESYNSALTQLKETRNYLLKAKKKLEELSMN